MAPTQLIDSLHPKSYQLQISPHRTKKCQHIITSKVYENQVTDHHRVITLTIHQLWQSFSKKNMWGESIDRDIKINIVSDFQLQQNPMRSNVSNLSSRG